eukprot:8466923-Alexandrium_andersonii.AAC.1
MPQPVPCKDEYPPHEESAPASLRGLSASALPKLVETLVRTGMGLVRVVVRGGETRLAWDALPEHVQVRHAFLRRAALDPEAVIREARQTYRPAAPHVERAVRAAVAAAAIDLAEALPEA